jgi:hypothetical protein
VAAKTKACRRRHDVRSCRERTSRCYRDRNTRDFGGIARLYPCSSLEKHSESRSRCDGSPDSIDDRSDRYSAPGYDDPSVSRKLTFCCPRLANLDNGVFDRLGRHEAALWRQIVQTLFALQTIRRRSLIAGNSQMCSFVGVHASRGSNSISQPLSE